MARALFAVSPTIPVLARVPALPAGDTESPAGAALLEEGIFLASRHTFADLERDPGSRDSGRVRLTQRSYHIRARLRPVPHGVFAGTALARFSDTGDGVVLCKGPADRVRTQPSAAWLAALREQLLNDSAVVPRLTFSANNVVTRRGARLVHERPAQGGRPPQRISIRATGAIDMVLSCCTRPRSAAEISQRVGRRWKVEPSLVLGMLADLVRDGFLLDDLLPADLTADPLGHLLSRLGPDHPLDPPLRKLRDVLADADRHRPGESGRLALLREARALTDQICPVDRPLTADVEVDANVVLPAAIRAVAVRAAEALWKTGHSGDPLADLHQRFVRRFGSGRFVPLLDAIDPVLGLDPGDPDDGPGHPERGLVLAELIGRAANSGAVEVALTEGDIARLAAHAPPGPPPRSADITVRVIASTAEDLAAGRFELAVCPGSAPEAGTALGRFASLLHPRVRERDEDALLAEIVTAARIAEGATIATPTGFTGHRIPIGVTPQPGDLPLEDLGVGSDGRRLILRSARHNRTVLPILYSRINSRLLPPVARFLRAIGDSGCRPLRGWSWQPADAALFTPRVRYQRAILTPARWTLPQPMIAAAEHRADWPETLTRWRTETTPSPPRVVVVDDADRLLPLDLDRDDDRELLRRYVRRGIRTVCEIPGGAEAFHGVLPGPNGRHLLELVIPLARTTPPAPLKCAATEPRPYAVGLHLPGGQWLSLAIRTPYAEQLIPELTTAAADLAGHYERWFWLRYHTPELGPHVRARFRGDPATLGGQLLPALARWCQDMIRQRLAAGFSVEPYDPEVERYGGPTAITAAETVFATDSALAATLITEDLDPDQRLVLAALSAATITITLTDNPQKALQARQTDRASRRHTRQLRPTVRAARDQMFTGSDPVRDEWAARRDALIAYRGVLDPALAPDCASSVVHMHVNRLIGNPEHEPAVRVLATDLLNSRPRT